MSVIKSLAVCCLAILVSACMGTAPVDPLLKFKVIVYADDTINPSKGVPAKPVLLRFYQLKDPGKFMGEKGPGLFTSDDTILAGSLLGKEELTPLVPGETREVEVLIHKEAKFFAVLAEFSDYQSANYRSVLPLGTHKTPQSADDTILVILSGNNVAVFRPAVKKPWWKI
jgi:type VI secretion system protein VasD